MVYEYEFLYRGTNVKLTRDEQTYFGYRIRGLNLSIRGYGWYMVRRVEFLPFVDTERIRYIVFTGRTEKTDIPGWVDCDKYEGCLKAEIWLKDLETNDKRNLLGKFMLVRNLRDFGELVDMILRLKEKYYGTE